MLFVSLVPIIFLGLIIMVTTASTLKEHSNEIGIALSHDVINLYKDNIEAQAQQINLELEQINHAVMFLKKQVEIIYENEENYPVKGPIKLSKFSDGFYWDGILGDSISNTNVIGQENITDEMSLKLARSIYLEPFFREAYEQNRHIAALYFITPDSTSRIYPAMNPYTEINENYLDPTIPVTTFPFYQTAMKNPKPSSHVRWTESYLDITHRSNMFSATTPVYNGNRLLGVVGADVTIKTVVEEFLNYKFSNIPGAYSFIFSKNGGLIAIQNNGINHYKRVTQPYIARHQTLDKQEIVYLDDGYILLTSKIKEADWYLGYMIKKDSIVAPIHEKTLGEVQYISERISTHMVGASILFMVICLLLAILLWKMMTKPIKELLVGIDGIDHGNVKVQVTQPVITEFNKVIHSFNGMSTRISDLLQELRQRLEEKEILHNKLVILNRGLEDQVNSRTRELQTANKALIEKNIQLKEMAKSRSALFSNISHDLKTPLTLLSAYLEALLDGMVPKQKQEDYLRKMQGKIFSLNRLVHDIYEISFLDSNPDLVQKKIVSVSEVIGELKKKWSFDVKQATVPLHFNCNQETLVNAVQYTIKIDLEYVHRAILNLIDNAYKYGDKTSAIVCTIELLEGHLEIAVTNQGEAIPEEYHSKIFYRSFRIDKSRNSAIQGHGLGLSIVKEIVELHGGYVSVKSKEEEGTTFTISLPIEKCKE